jgi:hypothetical protein
MSVVVVGDVAAAAVMMMRSMMTHQVWLSVLELI